MHALDYIQKLTGIERARIAIAADCSPGYVTRMLSTREVVNYVPLALAVAAARHSNGAVDIFASLKPDYRLDWSTLRDYLNRKL